MPQPVYSATYDGLLNKNSFSERQSYLRSNWNVFSSIFICMGQSNPLSFKRLISPYEILNSQQEYIYSTVSINGDNYWGLLRFLCKWYILKFIVQDIPYFMGNFKRNTTKWVCSIQSTADQNLATQLNDSLYLQHIIWIWVVTTYTENYSITNFTISIVM
jgi:hypothetical protein